MTKIARMRYKPVETIPRMIEDGVLFVSREYKTAVHNCCCGCGNEIVTPLGPTDWAIDLNSDAVSIYPSIGNWSLPCRSHYWIKRGRVHWAEQWSQAQIEYGRTQDRAAKQRQYGEYPAGRPGFWSWLWRFITGK